MILILTEMKILPGKKKEVLQTLHYIAGICRSVSGCVSLNIYQDIEDRNRVVKSVIWRTKKDVEEHMLSEHYEVLLGMGRTLCSSMKHSIFSYLEDLMDTGDLGEVNNISSINNNLWREK